MEVPLRVPAQSHPPAGGGNPLRDRLAAHPRFRAWRDPVSGVESYLLTDRVAPVQQSFYYTNPSMSRDARWLWVYCAFPPAERRSLAAVSLDPDRPALLHFPQAQFVAESPMVLPAGDEVLFADTRGRFRCVGCAAPLFAADAKFDSGTGWPSFTDAEPGSVELHRDLRMGVVRTEVSCRRCGGHLGHLFNDGPAPGGKRYCINACVLGPGEPDSA